MIYPVTSQFTTKIYSFLFTNLFNDPICRMSESLKYSLNRFGREGRIPSVGPTNQTFPSELYWNAIGWAVSSRKGATPSGVSESWAFREQETSQIISKFDFGFNNLNA